ncbi:hypothetical protein EDC91_1218 [Shewanella fodinae]|jgi:hypothetical protein|uniref:Uncharacterized protein n=1 Tax=Shewanella fodinae TaxID=552357 RepID=A0A4R2F6L1_9GAMM|nr:hypothetical protein EDC91_1218 [Shewanella fodinae]
MLPATELYVLGFLGDIVQNFYNCADDLLDDVMEPTDAVD